eukprot:TRINITY_DN1163_c0_g1_i2.p1 TRINITY_DN1163_c0_g1~~TRINITY_DN1163_c0_g1_i2.p1  ORF type:complete len:299 (-),score=50.14 TRINITY_DN1163_c0_g1_i2:71-841(-)
MEEMRKRAQRYREKPVDALEESLAALDLKEGGQGLVSKMHQLHDKIFIEHPIALGKAISRKERDHLGKAASSTLTYGEVTFDALAVALSKIRHVWGPKAVSGEAGPLQEPGGVFVDLGSGTGKGVIAAALFHQFTACHGIEILEGLYKTSLEIKKSWDEKHKEEAGASATVNFWHGDATDLGVFDWSAADVVFANSTCFHDALMRSIADCCASLRVGAFVITFTRQLPSPLFTVLEHQMYEMSWGGATVFIQQKTS